MQERFLDIADPVERENLSTFVSKAVRLDEAAVIRLRTRPDGRVAAWATTGFDALATRAIAATLRPSDTTAGADALLQGLESAVDGRVDLGYSMDSAWRGALPPDQGFVHVDDVPARVLVDLAQRGAALAKEHGSSHGPPASLLEQEVIEVRGAGMRVGISMRIVFALTAMGFVPVLGSETGDPLTADLNLDRIDPAELVRVRADRTWVRLDGRFGSVAKRRAGEIPLMVR